MFKNLKKLLLPAMALALSLTLAGCGNSGNTGSSKERGTDTGLKTIKIATPGQGGVLVENAMLAKGLGYIDEELEAAGYKAEYMGFAQA